MDNVFDEDWFLKLEASAKLAQKRKRALRRVLMSEDGKVVVEWMRERFGVDLPCFQFVSDDERRGYDPMDAMRRDAYREVFLWFSGLPEDGEVEGEEL